MKVYLAVVNGESDGEHVLGVAHEAAGGGAGVQVPQPQGAVPRPRERELAVAADDHILWGEQGRRSARYECFF